MKNIVFGLFMIMLAFSVWAEEPKLQKGAKLKVADKLIDFKQGHLVPVVSDWNNDGKKDLIVGHFSGSLGGNMKLFLNQGTDAAPMFKEGIQMQAGDKPIRMKAG